MSRNKLSSPEREIQLDAGVAKVQRWVAYQRGYKSRWQLILGLVSFTVFVVCATLFLGFPTWRAVEPASASTQIASGPTLEVSFGALVADESTGQPGPVVAAADLQAYALASPYGFSVTQRRLPANATTKSNLTTIDDAFTTPYPVGKPVYAMQIQEYQSSIWETTDHLGFCYTAITIGCYDHGSADAAFYIVDIYRPVGDVSNAMYRFAVNACDTRGNTTRSIGDIYADDLAAAKDNIVSSTFAGNHALVCRHDYYGNEHIVMVLYHGYIFRLSASDPLADEFFRTFAFV